MIVDARVKVDRSLVERPIERLCGTIHCRTSARGEGSRLRLSESAPIVAHIVGDSLDMPG